MQFPPKFTYASTVTARGHFVCAGEGPGQEFVWGEPIPEGFVSGSIGHPHDPNNSAVWQAHGYENAGCFFEGLHDEIPEEVWPSLEALVDTISTQFLTIAARATAYVAPDGTHLGYVL